MRTFFQRNAYLLVLFVPTAIYVLSYSLFEINAKSSLDMKQHIIDTIKKHQDSPVSEFLGIPTKNPMDWQWFAINCHLYLAPFLCPTDH